MHFRKKSLILAIAVTLIASGVYLFYVNYNPKKTLRRKLAELFDRPVELIELNLPPADGRYPGTVLLTAREGQSLTIKRENRPIKIPIKTSQVTITADGSSDVKLFGELLGALNSSGDISIQIDLDELRLFETDLNSEFKDKLLSNESIINAEKNGLKPRAIVRAYEAIVTYTVKKGSKIKGEHWNKIKEQLIEVGGSLSSSGGVTIKVEAPSIVAYETVLINFISTNLKAGKPDGLIFKEYIVPDITNNHLDLEQFNLDKGDSNVKYIALGNSTYQSKYFGNLRIVPNSLELVSSVFNIAGAESAHNSNNEDFVSEKLLDNILDDLEKSDLKSDYTSLLLFYYVGHAVSGPNGHSYLVLNEYNGNPSEDIGENFYHGLYRESIDHKSSPLSGSNFSDILDLMGVIAAEYPEEVSGLYPVSKISNKLEKLGIPFVIIIDACYSHEQMEKLRNRLNLTKNGDYYGPNDYGGPNEFLKYSDAIKRFRQAPYLNSSNVVILSSAPGSIAVEIPSPKATFFKNEFVAPLAGKIYNQLNRFVANTKPVSYGDFLYSLVDVKKMGEVKIHGVTSWSDFTLVNNVEMLNPKAKYE